jgi:hypothetical protein
MAQLALHVHDGFAMRAAGLLTGRLGMTIRKE